MQEADRLRLRHFLQTAHKIQRRAFERQRFLLLCVIARHDTGPNLDGAGRGGVPAPPRPAPRSLATALPPDAALPLTLEQPQIHMLNELAPTHGIARSLSFPVVFVAAV